MKNRSPHHLTQFGNDEEINNERHFTDDFFLADEDISDLLNYGYYKQEHHSNHPSSPFFSSSNNSSNNNHHQVTSSPNTNNTNNIQISVSIETAIDENFRKQWSNYDLKKDNEMYEKYNIALKITNLSQFHETPNLLLNCRHEIHDKGDICQLINKKTNICGDYLDFLLFDGNSFQLQPREEKIIIVSISRPSKTMVSHGKYFIQFFVLTFNDFQCLCHTKQIKILTSKNKNNRTKRINYDPTRQDISVKNLVPKEWQSLQTSHQVFDACFWDDIILSGEKRKLDSKSTTTSSSGSTGTITTSVSNNNTGSSASGKGVSTSNVATSNNSNNNVRDNSTTPILSVTPHSVNSNVSNSSTNNIGSGSSTNSNNTLQPTISSPFKQQPLHPLSPGIVHSPLGDFFRQTSSPFREDTIESLLNSTTTNNNNHLLLDPLNNPFEERNYIPIETHVSIIKIFQKQIDFYKHQLEVLLRELKRYDKRMAESIYKQYVHADVLGRTNNNNELWLNNNSLGNSSWEESLPSEEDLENMFNKMKIIKEQIEQSISNNSKQPPPSPISFTNNSNNNNLNSNENSIDDLYNVQHYDVEFDDDVTIPDFSTIPCNTNFIKTWRVTNCGLPFPIGTSIVVKSDKETPLEYGEILLPLTNTDEQRVLTEQELAGINECKNISVSIKSPIIEGLWRREYCLQLPNGLEFGDNLVVLFKTVK
ncbi:hypothetical protein ABK040_003358 [Willaertia magna]